MSSRYIYARPRRVVMLASSRPSTQLGVIVCRWCSLDAACTSYVSGTSSTTSSPGARLCSASLSSWPAPYASPPATSHHHQHTGPTRFGLSHI
jgi:hypothetical protein